MKYFFLVLFSFKSIFSLPTSDSLASEEWDSVFSQNDTSFIQLFHDGPKIYYFGYHCKATYFQAAQICQDIHMKLVSIESATENEILYKHIRDAGKSDIFWTSGSRLLDGNHWIWMSKGKPIDYSNWHPGNPDSQTEHCIAAFSSDTARLTWLDKDCLIHLSFICEKSAESKDTKDVKQAESEMEGLYHEHSVSPNIPLFHFKEKSYFIGRQFKVTFQEAMQLCQMINMNLVSITSNEENNRIHKYIRDTNSGEYFWTSGTRMIDGITWFWMSTARIIDYTNWYTGKPSGASHCILLMEQSDKGLFWINNNCMARYFYICEKPRKEKQHCRLEDNHVPLHRVYNLLSLYLEDLFRM
ncbi:hypothetical protein NQ315_002977 [Exocentrus adspersus]|uniref:C-type lectin domain-containing protein n=1 Tax=Exocentrus adspersus TaxID=1586481 RepID=A0AAV8W445_9CUCU|nr:hypothetical protein NQ315_002977 [Exocentrus adspersus]